MTLTRTKHCQYAFVVIVNAVVLKLCDARYWGGGGGGGGGGGDGERSDTYSPP